MKETQTCITRNYPEPSPELIDDIRRRLREVPQDILERAHHALMHAPIQEPATILWKAGVCLASHELYEYRKTFFPPNALVDPLTQGPPVVRDATQLEHPNANISATTDGGPVTSEINPPIQGSINPALNDARKQLLQLLSARSHPSDHEPLTLTTDHEQPTTGHEPLINNTNPSSQEPTDLSAGPTLLTDLRSLLSRHVVLPEMAAEALALWVVHTYAFTLRDVTTYIGVVSPEKRCGKTTLLELLGLLAHRSLTASNISPSALFRVIEEIQPTLLIDEADTFLHGRDELGGILNAGYRKGNSFVVRVAERKSRKTQRPGNGPLLHNPTPLPVGLVPPPGVSPAIGDWTTTDHPPQVATPPSTQPSPPEVMPALGGSEFVKYSCWCPKVMATIGRLPDTLADRCIVINMQRKMPGEKCERMRRLNPADFRNRCAEFVRHHSHAIAQACPDLPATLNDRAADIWEPLFAIADLAGGQWPELARQAAQKLSASDDGITLVGYFLRDLRNYMLITHLDRVLSRDIVTVFNAMHTRPWEDLRRGREINEWWLGHRMSELGIRSRNVRVGETVGRGYLLPDIESAFRRYVPNPELHSAPAPDRDPTHEPAPPPPSEDNTPIQMDKLVEQLLRARKASP